MRIFFNIVGHEYKKMLSRKSALISIVLVALITLIAPALRLTGSSLVDGEVYESHYDAMLKDRAHARALSGRVLDEALFNEALDAYAKVPADAARPLHTPEYEQYARPYSGIYGILTREFPLKDDANSILDTPREQLADYYTIRANRVIESINRRDMSQASKDALIESAGTVKTPFVFDYSDGFHDFFAATSSIAVLIAVAVAVCLAPMFAGEYTTGASELILCTKLGKGKLIAAKLFAALSFTFVYALGLTLASLLIDGLIYGYDGASSPIQLLHLLHSAPYNFTVKHFAAIFILCVTLAVVLTAALTLLLSARLKSPFAVIIPMGAMLFIPMMFTVSPSTVWFYNLFQLLPANIMQYSSALSYPYEIFGLPIMPYVFLPLFAFAATCVLLPFAWRGFKKHQ
jgi:ABC-type transport system involved in multi-copper enzyme maturation permease subunit